MGEGDRERRRDVGEQQVGAEEEGRGHRRPHPRRSVDPAQGEPEVDGHDDGLQERQHLGRDAARAPRRRPPEDGDQPERGDQVEGVVVQRERQVLAE